MPKTDFDVVLYDGFGSTNEPKSKTGGVRIDGRRTRRVLPAESRNDMNKTLNTSADMFDKHQLKINGQKTKTVLISKIYQQAMK